MATDDAGAPADVTSWAMADIDPDQLSSLKPEPVYRRRLDTFTLMFYGIERPSVGLVMDNNFTLRIDPETGEVIGVEISHFLSEAVEAHPELLPLLNLPVFEPRDLRRVRKRVATERHQEEAVQIVVERIFRQHVRGG